jgi:hypothetical protein
MAVLLSDDFNRADSTNVLGSPQVGGPYTVVSGTWGIQTNRAYVSVGLTGSKVTFPAAKDIDISITLGGGVSSSVQHGAMFRYVDASNFWALHARTGSGTVGLYLTRGGVNNLMLQWDHSSTTGTVLRAVAVGPNIAVYANGVLGGVMQDPFWDNNASAAGLLSWGSGIPHFDSVLASDATSVAAVDDWGTNPEAFDGVDLGFTADADYLTSLYKGRDTAAADESEIP